MKYTIMGFNQQKAVEFNLDTDDLLILSYFSDFRDTELMVCEEFEGKKYYWVKYEALLENLPILRAKNKDSIRRRFKKLQDAQILVHKCKKSKEGTYSFYGIGENYLTLKCSRLESRVQDSQLNSVNISTRLKSRTGTTQKSDGVRFKSRTGTTQKSDQNINLLKDSSIKNINLLKYSSSSRDEVEEEEIELKEVLRLCKSFGYKLKEIDAKCFIDAFNGQVVKKAIGIAVNTEAFRNKTIKNYSSYLASILKDLSTEETKNININHQKKDLKFNNYVPRTYENDSYDDFIGWEE